MKTRAWPILAIGASLGVLLSWIIMDRAPVVEDNSDEHLTRIDSIARENRRLRAERVMERLAYRDSLRAWETRRAGLQRTAERARVYADSIAAILATDSTIAPLVDELRGAHFIEVEAERAKTDTWKAEALALRQQVATDSLLIASLYTEIEAHETLDAERVRVNESLRDALRKQHRNNKILAVAGVGLAILAIR